MFLARIGYVLASVNFDDKANALRRLQCEIDPLVTEQCRVQTQRDRIPLRLQHAQQRHGERTRHLEKKHPLAVAPSISKVTKSSQNLRTIRLVIERRSEENMSHVFCRKSAMETQAEIA